MNGGRAPLAPVPGLSRTASISPPPTRRVVPEHQDAAAADSVTQVIGKSGPPARPVKVTTTSVRMSDTAQTMRSVTLSLPSGVVRQIKDRARAERVSQPELVMDALIAARGRFDDLLAAERRPTVSDGLFLRRTSSRSNNDPLATLSLRMLVSNVAAIDDLVQTHHAPSRSALCLAALKAYLAGSA